MPPVVMPMNHSRICVSFKFLNEFLLVKMKRILIESEIKRLDH